MSHRRKNTPLVLTALALMTATGTSLVLQDDRSFTDSLSRNDQPYYAEISTTSPPFGLSNTESPGTINVPILVYHIVRPSYPDDSPAVQALAHTPEIFAAQMRMLQDRGYTVVSFSDLENHFRDESILPVKPIIISFDDGWRDQFEYAVPILLSYRYPATFFVFTNSIGKRGFFSWGDLKTLRDEGMTIGSHSRSHPYLTQITDPEKLRDEIFGSKQILEKNLGISVDEFAYPFGQYNPSIVEMVREAGYASGRGDFYSGRQSKGILYTLSAMNTPVTVAQFSRLFP